MKGYIYALRSSQTTDVYYGSTVQMLCQRFAGHKVNYKKWTQKKPGTYITACEVLQYDDCYIELVEELEVKNRKELVDKEVYYIQNFPCVNKSRKNNSPRTEYMRNYMNKRYNEKHDECRADQNTRRVLSKQKVSQEDIEKYGIHLSDVLKLKKLITIIPPDMIRIVRAELKV
jgi:hypothetical protein